MKALKKILMALFCVALSVGAFACAENTDSPSNSQSGSQQVTPAAKQYNVTYNGVGVTESTAKADENSLLDKPADPTRDYYAFDGWYNGETKWDFATDKVTQDVTLTAKWTAKVYTVKFVAQDGETVVEEKTYTCETIEEFEAPAVPAAPQYFENGRWDKAEADYLTYSEETVVVVAAYDRVQVAVTFMDGEEEVDSVNVGANLVITDAPAAPAKDYYVFDGWYNGETKWNLAEDVVTEALTLTAKYVAKEYKVILKDVAGNETELTYTVENVDEFELPAATAPEGYENVRWSKTLEECTVFSDEPIVVETLCEAGELVYVNAIKSADEAEDIDGLKEAIAEYREYVENLDEEKKATLVHQAYLAEVNMIITENFYEGAEGKLAIGQVKPAVSGDFNLLGDDADCDVGNLKDKASSTDKDEKYVKSTWEHYWVIQTQNNSSGGLTFPAIDYSAYNKVEFGMYICPAEEITVTADGQSIGKFTNAWMHGFKVVISGRMVSVYDDHITEKDGGGLIAQIVMSNDVYSGKAGLAFSFETTGWTQVQTTEFHYYAPALSGKAIAAVATVNNEKGGETNVELLEASASQFKGKGYESFTYTTGSYTDAKFRLNAVNFNAYEEVVFGFAFAVTGSKGAFTIAGETFTVPSKWLGHWYRMKAIVKDGYLTMVDDGSQKVEMMEGDYF